MKKTAIATTKPPLASFAIRLYNPHPPFCGCQDRSCVAPTFVISAPTLPLDDWFFASPPDVRSAHISLLHVSPENLPEDNIFQM